jgi:outer membrane protein TolC
MRAVAVIVALATTGRVAWGQAPPARNAQGAPVPGTAPSTSTPPSPSIAPSNAPGAQGITLEQAIRLALTRNERSRIAELDVVQAEAGVSRARSAFLPTLSASGNDALRWRGDHNAATGAITLSQPLIQPTAWPLYAQAKHELSATQAQARDDKRQLAFDAAKAFFDVLLADEVVQAAKRKLETSKADVADTDAQVRAQLVSSNDVTRAKIDLASSEREVAADQGDLDRAYVQLALLLNQRVAGGLEVPQAMLAAGVRPLASADELVSQSLARRPDLFARKDFALAAHDFAREPRMRWLPSFGLTGQFTASSRGNGETDDHTDATLAISASWVLYDAGERYADARSRDAAAAIADLNTDNLIRTIDAEVRTAAVALHSAQLQLVAANDAMLAARKSADETAILYHQQLARAIELLDANDQRFTAEVNYAVAQFSVATAYLAVRQAMGLDPIGDLP